MAGAPPDRPESPEPPAGGADETAGAAGARAVAWVAAFLTRRRHLLVRLGRVDAMLARWDAADADAQLPAERRRYVCPPALSRATLEGLQDLVVEELLRLEGGPADA